MASSQNTETPHDFFMAMQSYWDITFKYDMAASDDNSKCNHYFNERDNSLSKPWPKDGWCWLNPPFRKLSQFVPKVNAEAACGSRIVTIWPLSGDLNQIVTYQNAEVNIVHGRVWGLVRGVMLCRWGPGVFSGVYGLKWDKTRLERIW